MEKPTNQLSPDSECSDAVCQSATRPSSPPVFVFRTLELRPFMAFLCLVSLSSLGCASLPPFPISRVIYCSSAFAALLIHSCIYKYFLHLFFLQVATKAASDSVSQTTEERNGGDRKAFSLGSRLEAPGRKARKPNVLPGLVDCAVHKIFVFLIGIHLVSARPSFLSVR